ncbi:adenylate/guanylate cyclase domain-containing protein [Roseofilum reptotaenium CS-1145]|uniref:Adenylate/guanylate cyclase domain-containing response regulator n=1 Tax=Roseofilum reptotaenium AO1-A TaxID=1925591 RepID=A0A1L9QLB7_9CYAN|nr:adenylate/guanylate cyclase domain-containing protein [Roseofilum reptotaenium]MDB9517175.1 adenylate/guanylate cyclase domain-containing protein [Roseofilum reptotaenium CS-1145]OJJ18422.1 adenylate/guanylate cyclase domain-containing response regulator [Roseofilum reptotaenium AO1-A]
MDSVEERIAVLLIDDQPIISEAIRRMVADQDDIGFFYCSDPTEAFDIAQQCQPTVILQDLVMPQIDSLLLVKFLRSHDSFTCHIPLIVLSSKEDPIIKAKAFELGANDYLVKLPDQREIIARIRYHSKAYLNFLKRQEAEQLFKAEIMRQAAYIEQVGKVTTAASEVEQDNFQPDGLMEVAQRSDELGQLARVFSQMVKTVKSREKELTEANQKLEELLTAFGRFVPHEYLRFLRKKSITELQLGDHVSKVMAVMFSDIRSFTTLSESMTAKENFSFINTYLQLVTPRIHVHHGLIVKFLGDGIMAVFPETANDALVAGVDVFKEEKEWNQERRKEGEKPIEIGIGLHVGHIMLGMVGEQNRMQGDAFSDSINLTARLEGLTKFYGVSLLISEEVFNHATNADEFQLRFLDRAIVKGRNEAIAVYEVLDAADDTMRELKLKTQPDFEQGLSLYQQKDQLEAARACFEKVIAVNPTDKTALLYLDRIAQLLLKGVPEDWSGVWSFTEK